MEKEEAIKIKVKINELAHPDMDRLERLTRELKELQQDEMAPLIDIVSKQLEICKLINDINSEYATKKQTEYVI